MNVQEDKTVSFQGINETNTEKKLQCCMSLANQFVIYEKKNIYKYMFKYTNFLIHKMETLDRG